MDSIRTIIDYCIQVAPVIVVVLIYFVRLEIRLAKICENLKWIKKMIDKCQPHLDNDSQ